MLRIIAGEFRRRLIETPDSGEVTRPTSDRVRENVFNILSGYLPSARVLDLFSGSGAMGLEALSRDAKQVVFVEKDPRAYDIILRNLEKLGVHRSRYQVLKVDVSEMLRLPLRYLPDESGFDLVFADPPYKSDWYSHALRELRESGLLSKNCRVCIEMSRYTEVTEGINPHFSQVLQRDYGKTRVQVFEHL